MLKQVIKGWISAPGAPADWDPKKDGECGSLPVRVINSQGQTLLKGDDYALAWGCESAWQPTPAELEMLNAGGNVILRCVGWQIPVALYVEPREEDEESPI